MPRAPRPGGRYHHRFGIRIRIGPGIFEWERRIVMAEILGRPLRPNERVFHRNGNRFDSRPENLELRIYPRPNHWISCACGCGQRLREFGTDSRAHQFIQGHNARLRPPRSALA